jgi:LPS export ABC transporter protein LptC
MRRFRPWIFGILLALLFTEIWLGFPIRLENHDLDAPKAGSEAAPNEAQQKMKGVHLVESSAGDRDWELFADAAEGYEGKGKWQLQKVKILFYAKNQVQFTVTGEDAEIDTKTKDMKIEGNVKTISENGYRFESPLLLYLSKQRLLQSPGPVRMTGPSDLQGEGLTLSSNYMRSFVDRSEMNLEGNVTAQKKFKNGHHFLIRSDKAQFSGLHYQAHFQDQVVIEYDSMKLESPEASFQYKSASSPLDTVQLKGGVRISDLDKYATADLVRIEPETNRIVLSGKPRVVQDQDEILGDQIVFIDGGKKVKIEKMRARVEKAPGE